MIPDEILKAYDALDEAAAAIPHCRADALSAACERLESARMKLRALIYATFSAAART